jgi:hypothetical protein
LKSASGKDFTSIPFLSIKVNASSAKTMVSFQVFAGSCKFLFNFDKFLDRFTREMCDSGYFHLKPNDPFQEFLEKYPKICHRRFFHREIDE